MFQARWESHDSTQFRIAGAVISLLLSLTLSLISISACRADPAPVIHYTPVENLEHADVALIDQAEHNIDLAAYVNPSYGFDLR